MEYPTREDRLIQQVVDSPRRFTEEELRRVLAGVASAPFTTRLIRPDARLQGKAYLGVRFTGDEVPSSIAHTAKRVLVEQQWPVGTPPPQYLDDLRRAIMHPSAEVYTYRYGFPGLNAPRCLGIAAPNHVQAPQSEPRIWVVYSAKDGTITTGYQFTHTSDVKVLEGPADRWNRVRHR